MPGHDRRTNRLLALLSLFMGVFLLLPLLALIVQGVMQGGLDALPDSGVPGAVALSLLTTGLSAVIIALLGTPLAYVLARRRFPLRGMVMVLIQLPIVLPPAVAGLALLLTFGRRGLLGPLLEAAGITLPFSTAAVIMAQVFVAAPFFIRAAQVGFAVVDPDAEEAARVDGAAGFMLFRRITLPLTGPSLAAGLVLAWARALGEFGATILFAGNLPGRTRTMPLLVYSIFEQDIRAATWTGLILIGLALGALLISQWFARRAGVEAGG